MPARRSNRWTQDDPIPGSYFHELVVLPTLAPHLARPEYLGATTGPIVLPQPQSQQLDNGAAAVGQPPGTLTSSCFISFTNKPAVGINPADGAAHPASTPSAAGAPEAEARFDGSGNAGKYLPLSL